jgi:hypothetical protein
MPILGIIASQDYPRSTNSYESIATYTLGSNQTTITFSSIPATFTHLQLRIFARTNRTGQTEANLLIRFNNDTGSNYTYHDLYSDGTTATASAGGASQTSIIANRLTGAGATASIFGAIVVDVLDYTSTNKNKTVRALGGVDRNGAGGLSFSSGLYFATPAAINRIDLTTIAGTFDFVQHSSFALYGIKGV